MAALINWPQHPNGENKSVAEMSMVEGMNLIKQYEQAGDPLGAVLKSIIAFAVLERCGDGLQ